MYTPQQFVAKYTGQAIAYDPAYGVQCVGGFKVFCRAEGIPVISCPNNWAESYWSCMNKSGAVVPDVVAWVNKYFTRITDYRKFKNGDWVVWPRGCGSHPASHIAMFYNGQEFGQRQYESNRAFCLKNTDFRDSFGALRWKGFEDMVEVPAGHPVNLVINGHEYRVHRMTASDQIFVLSKGLNKVAPLTELDGDAFLVAKIGGANFYQAETGQSDPYGTTYGDISSTLNKVYQSLPLQDSTLFYDLTTGEFGDCSQHEVDPTHEVYSPCLVFPNNRGNWEYARMVGLGHKDYKSYYTFCVRFADGYCVGKALQMMTPQEIANDFFQTDMLNIAFLDGGHSAQGAFWNAATETMEYIGETKTPVGSGLGIGRAFGTVPKPETGEAEPVPPTDQEKDEEIPMENETVQETPQIDPKPIPEWTDPELGKTTVKDRLVAMLSIKSLLTLSGNGVFLYLTVVGKIAPEVFMAVFSSEVAFYFGTTFQKGGGK